MAVLLILINLRLDSTLCYEMKAKFLLDNNISPIFNHTHRELARILAKDQFDQLKNFDNEFNRETADRFYLEGIDNVTDKYGKLIMKIVNLELLDRIKPDDSVNDY